MKLNNKFLIIILLTVLETFGLMVILLVGMQKITSMKEFQYKQGRMQLHLTETVNFVNNVNLYSVKMGTVYDDWDETLNKLEEDIKGLTDDDVLNQMPEVFQDVIKYIPNLWRSMKFPLANMSGEFKKLQDIPITDVENFYLVQYGIGGAKPFLVDQEHYQEISDTWRTISDLISNFRITASQMSELNEVAVADLEDLCRSEITAFARTAFIIAIIASIVLVTFVRITTGRITKRIMKVRDVSGNLKEKDFTVEIKANGSTEMRDLMNNMNSMIFELNGFLNTVKDAAAKAIDSGYKINESANSTAAATTQIDANIESITREFDQISQSVERSVQIIEEMNNQVDNLVMYNERQTKSVDDANRTVFEVAQTLRNMAEMAQDRARDAKEMNTLVADGDAKIKQSAQKLSKIEEQLSEISGIVKIINDIASQTNLLSMNAAIESAHAGEAGKGFSVVAAEIRSLAENTAANAKRIKLAIGDIVNTVTDASVAGGQASEAFGKVRINADQVVTSMEEISSGISHVDQQMDSIKEKTGETAQAAQEITGYSSKLAEKQRNVSDEVQSMNNRFAEAQNGIHEIKRGTSDIVSRITEVSANSNDSYQNMTDLEQILSEFKTQKETPAEESPEEEVIADAAEEMESTEEITVAEETLESVADITELEEL